MNKKILILVLGIFLVAGIFASYSLGSPKESFKETYSKGENIAGWINISLQDESVNSVFSDSVNSITLIDLLQTTANSKADYSCNPSNCRVSYDAINPAAQKQITLNAGQEKLIGFVLSDNIESISDFNLTITSDAVKSDENQLKIDLFNDGANDIGNTKAFLGEWSSPRDYSCFNFNEPQIKEGGIKSGDTICQRVKLPEAPGFSLGASLKKENSADSLNLKMSLYDIDSENDLESCTLPEASTTETEIFCDVESLVTKQKDYYVCLTSESGVGTYKIKTYGFTNDRCGFKGFPGDEEIAAYRIFSQSRFFDAIGTLEISDTLPTGNSISSLINSYIDDNYNNLSCAGRECIVPIKLISNVQQTITIGGGIEYDSSYSSGLKEEKIYDLSEDSAKVTASAQKIFLDNANFTVPNSVGEYEFKLSLNNAEIIKKQIEVKKGIEILSVNPTKTAAGLPTNFKIKINTNNITAAKYKWDFNGDEMIDKTTLTNSVEYAYFSTGNYTLIISVEDSEGASSSESFSIQVESAKDVLDDLITEKQEEISDIKGEISGYDLFSLNAIENVLNLSGIESSIQDINSKYLAIKDTGTEQKFQAILLEILEIELPKSISKSLDSAPLTFFPKKENIDLSVVEAVAGGTYDASLEEEYKDALLTWNLKNVRTKISIKEYSANYIIGSDMLVKTFSVDAKDLGASSDAYLFVREMEGINFKEEMSYDESSGYYSKPLGNIEFYTTEDIALEDLPLFISPSLESLSVDLGAGIEPEKAGKKFNWLVYILVIFFVLFLAFVVYLLLKKWYDTKYENYLFKNKNDLYNIVTYVHGFKQQGKTDDEIARNLKKSGWSSEQVNYVMKKYAGKKVGLPGFGKNQPKVTKPEIRKI